MSQLKVDTITNAAGTAGPNFSSGLTGVDYGKWLFNAGLSTSVATNAMTVNLLTGAGSTPSAASPVQAAFRSATAATGTYVVRSVTGALSIVISSGATLGLVSAQNQFIYLYALDNAGTVELAVAGTRSFDEGTLQSSTTMSGSATSNTVLYSTTGRSNVAIRYLGRIKSNQTTSGTYTSNSTELTISSSLQDKQQRSELWYDTTNGYGSSGTTTRRWTNARTSIGSAITYASDATNGDTFTINEDGVYAIHYTDQFSVTNGGLSPTRNSNQTATDVTSNTFTAANRLSNSMPSAADRPATCSATLNLQTGDVIRAQTSGATAGVNTFLASFRITKVSD